MRLLLSMLFTGILAASANANIVISEFQSNPPGGDPATTMVEFFGTPGSTFSGFLSTIEADGPLGNIDRQSAVSGTYDANGLFVVTVPDFENPSFVLVAHSLAGGGIGTDLDADGDGNLDNPAALGTIFDAVGVYDNNSDNNTYAAELGGIDLVTTGSEPEIVFRAGSNGAWFYVDDIGDDTSIFDAAANNVLASAFDTDPSAGTTFGAINPVPEPSSIALVAGLMSLGLVRRRRA